MIVGFTESGRLLEIGAELMPPDDHLHFSHATDATKAYRDAFEEYMR